MEKFERDGHLPGLAKYLVEGAKAYYDAKARGEADPFGTPASIAEYDAEEKHAADDVAQFLDDTVDVEKSAEPEAKTAGAELYNRYVMWHTASGAVASPKSSGGFGETMSKYADKYPRKRSNGSWYRHLCLKQ